MGVGLLNLCCTCQSIDSTKLDFFYGPNISDHHVYNYDELEEIFKDDNFDANRPTALYIHGYRETVVSNSVQRIINAYLSRNDHNIIVLDWSHAASGNYFTSAVPNAMKVIEKKK